METSAITAIMNLSDIQLFVVATQHASLHAAAQHLNLTPSALSKAIRRLEDDLQTSLFDRAGNKSLTLNPDGQRFFHRALALIDLSEQTRSEFIGAEFRVHCRVAAPALLQWRYGPSLAEALSACYADSSLVLRPAYEDEALAALERGEVDFALITDEAIRSAKGGVPIETVALGELTMQLAAGPNHPLATKARSKSVRTSIVKIMEHDFVCPTRSMFCGLERGPGSDGWREQGMVRKIRYWVDDLQVLLSLVQKGKALAYLPEFALRECGLTKIDVTDSTFHCSESAHLAWRPVVAAGWQSVVVDGFCKLLKL